MPINSTLNLKDMLRKISAAGILLVGVVAFALASSGGGGSKKKSSSIRTDFKPVSLNAGFTLKAGPQYAGSMVTSQQRNKHLVRYNTVVTYQKGNTIYIMPYKYTMNTRPNLGFRSNLQVIDLKIRLQK